MASAILLVPAPPFVDFPWHLATAEIDADFDRVPAYSLYFAREGGWGPNSVYHSLAVWSGDPVRATRPLLAIAILATLAAMLALGRRYRAGPAYALTAGLFAIHFSLGYGFLEFVVGVPIALLAVLLLASEPAPRPARLAAWTAALAGLLLLTFFAHAILSCFTLAVVGAFAALRYRASRTIAQLAALAAVPAAVALFAWRSGRASDPSGAPLLADYYRHVFLPDYGLRVMNWFIEDHGFLISTRIGPILGAGVMLLALVSAAIIARRRGGESGDGGDRAPAPPMAAAHALAAVSLGIVLFAPSAFPPVWAVYQRFTFVAVVALALWAGARAAARGASAPRGLLVSLALANVAVGALWFEHVWRFGPTVAALRQLAAEADVSGPGAYVVGDPRWRGQPFALLHAANLMTAFGHRPVMSSLFDSPGSRIAFGPAWHATRYSPEGSHYVDVAQLLPDFDDFGWALVHASAPAAGREELERQAPTVLRSGEWTLYARPPATGPAALARGP